MHGRARMRLIGVINIICLVSLLENQETIKLYKDYFIHALCLIETSCDKGLKTGECSFLLIFQSYLNLIVP